MSAITAGPEPLRPHWLWLALGPPVALVGWLWAAGAFERVGCAISCGVWSLLAGG